MRREDPRAVTTADILFGAAWPAVLVGFPSDDVRDFVIEFRPFLVSERVAVLESQRPLQRFVGRSGPDPLQIGLAPRGRRRGADRRGSCVEWRSFEFQE